jgi:hypothetical protein
MEAGARDSSRRNVPSVQRVQFHHTRWSFGRSGGLELLEVRGPIVERSARWRSAGFILRPGLHFLSRF